MDLNLELQIAKEIINEEKRPNKIYSYLDTIIGTGYNKSGGGKGWTNWVTVNDNYDENMAKRVFDLTKLGVAKEETPVPIPDINDSNKLFTLETMFDDIKKVMNSFLEQATGVAEYYNLEESPLIPDTKSTSTTPELLEQRRIKQVFKQSLKQLNANNELAKVVSGYNRVVNYIDRIIDVKNINESDKNKITDKFYELLPILDNVIYYGELYGFSIVKSLMQMRTFIISKNFKPIKTYTYYTKPIEDDNVKDDNDFNEEYIDLDTDYGDEDDLRTDDLIFDTGVAEQKDEIEDEIEEGETEEKKEYRLEIKRLERVVETNLKLQKDLKERRRKLINKLQKETDITKKEKLNKLISEANIVLNELSLENDDIELDILRLKENITGRGRYKGKKKGKKQVKEKMINIKKIKDNSLNFGMNTDLNKLLSEFSLPGFDVSLTSEKQDKNNRGLYKEVQKK
jgi:hypothetical protein